MINERPNNSSIQCAVSSETGDVVFQVPSGIYRGRGSILIAIGIAAAIVASYDIPGLEFIPKESSHLVGLWTLVGIGGISGILLVSCNLRLYLVDDLLEESARLGECEVHSTQVLAKSITAIRKRLDIDLESNERAQSAALINAIFRRRRLIQIEFNDGLRLRAITMTWFKTTSERDWVYDCIHEWHHSQKTKVQ